MTNLSSIARTLACLAWLGATAALAQTPARPAAPPPTQAAVPAAPGQSATPASSNARATLDASRAELEQQEAALRRPGLPTELLQDMRARLDPVSERLRDLVADLGPQLEAAKARLEQLGPKPKEGAAPEGADVAKDRTDREGSVSEVDEAHRLARALLLQAEQLTSQISDRRRTEFTRALFQRGYSLVSPDLWVRTAESLPRDLRALRIVSEDAVNRMAGRASPGMLTLLGLAIGAALAFYFARRHVAPRLVHRARGAVEVNRRRKLLAAAGVLLLEVLPAAVGSVVVYQLISAADFLPPRLYPVLAAALGGLVFTAFLRAGLDALLAPDRPAWRLVGLSDAAASRTASFVLAFGIVVALGKVFDALNQAIAAGLPLSVLTRALAVTAAAVTLAELLRRFAVSVDREETCLGPYIPTEPEAGGPIRILGWAVIAAILLSVLAGYVAFGSFLTDQVAWTGSLALILYLGSVLIDEFVAGTMKREGGLSTTLQANLGLRRRSLEQLGVIVAGAGRLVLLIVIAMLALAPWGVESGDVASNLRAAFFGFQVGEVTISLSTLAGALLLFGLVIGAARILQRWLSNTFLPTTELDSGLRNSILTAAGYIGFFAAAAIAFAHLGVGLEKIAILAGALSVGIGFGLQSIVNNFVSGLILLWERPIRVGDLVVIGDGEGYVRRISVRATEIETFDRASVIIPNSNLISGVVKNRVRGDKLGRVSITVNVPRDKDPARAAEVLIEHASKHADVLSEPPPRAFFKKIGDSALEFELICIIADVSARLRIQSELNFAVFGALTSEGILPAPVAPAPVNLAGLEPVQGALEHIAESIASERKEAQPAPEPRRRPSVVPGE